MVGCPATSLFWTSWTRWTTTLGRESSLPRTWWWAFASISPSTCKSSSRNGRRWAWYWAGPGWVHFVRLKPQVYQRKLIWHVFAGKIVFETIPFALNILYSGSSRLLEWIRTATNNGPHARTFSYSYLNFLLLFFVQWVRTSAPRQIQQTLLTSDNCVNDLRKHDERHLCVMERAFMRIVN